MQKHVGLFLSLALGMVSSSAQSAYGPKYLGPVSDRDISGRGFYRLIPPGAPTDIAPDRIETTDDPTALTILIFREDHGKVTPVEGLTPGVATPSGWLPVRQVSRGATQSPGCQSPDGT